MNCRIQKSLKIKAMVLVLTLFLFQPLFSQIKGESLKFWDAFSIWSNATKQEINDKQVQFYIRHFSPDIYQKYSRDEFEWAEIKAEQKKKLLSEIANSSYEGKNYYSVFKSTFGDYDFESQGFPIEFESGSYFLLAKPDSYKFNRDEYNSIPASALWFLDMQKYNLFPMEKEAGKKFLQSRKSSNGYVDREIYLIINYEIVDFASSEYTDVKKMFERIEIIPIVGRIKRIDVYNAKDEKLGEVIQVTK